MYLFSYDNLFYSLSGTVCDVIQCRNGGTCLPDVNNPVGYFCQCTDGYTGPSCTEGELTLI